MAFDDLFIAGPDEREKQEPGGLVALGNFRFGVDTLPYQQIEQVNRYLWAEQNRIGNSSALHYVGKAATSIVMSGVFFPELRGGYEQMPKLKEQADLGKPLPMVDSRGNSLGEWVILSIQETHTRLTGDGLPKKNEFRIELKRYVE